MPGDEPRSTPGTSVGIQFPDGTRTVDAHISHLRARLDGSGVTVETYRG